MAPRRIDLNTIPVNEKFGLWTVRRAFRRSSDHDKIYVEVLCRGCGDHYERQWNEIKRGQSTRCVNCRNKTHGLTTGTDGERRAYNALRAAIHRCENPENQYYADYGGRGISVAAEWHGADGARRFVTAMPPHPGKGYSLERANNDGNYEPGNVRWALMSEQARNKRNSHVLEFQGERKVITDWAHEYAQNPDLVGRRLQQGWTVEDALLIWVRPFEQIKLLRRGLRKLETALSNEPVLQQEIRALLNMKNHGTYRGK